MSTTPRTQVVHPAGAVTGAAFILWLTGGTILAVLAAQVFGTDVNLSSSHLQIALNCAVSVSLGVACIVAPAAASVRLRRKKGRIVPGWALDVAILVIVVELATIVFFASLGAIGGGRSISFDRHGLGLLLMPGLSVVIVAMVLWELVRCRLRRWQRRRVRLGTPIAMVSTLAAVAGSSVAYAWAVI